MVNLLSAKFQQIYVPVDEKFLEQIRFLYKENNKVILFPVKLVSVNDADKVILDFGKKNNLSILKVGFDYEKKSNKPFYKAFYKQLGMPYKVSYNSFILSDERTKENELYSHLLDKFEIKDENFILVHDESSIGDYELVIDSRSRKISLSQKYDIFNNVFFYRKLIMKATEIHCVNSSFAHLVDRISPKGNLVYHDIRGSRLKFKNKWKYIDYEN
jgi:hypothetical protein